jgi:hypothetical protein
MCQNQSDYNKLLVAHFTCNAVAGFECHHSGGIGISSSAVFQQWFESVIQAFTSPNKLPA